MAGPTDEKQDHPKQEDAEKEDQRRKDKREERRILKNILLISTAFLLNFTGFQGLSRLQSSLHQVEGMGVINQGVLYAVLIVACMFIPKVMMAKIGHKWTITVSILGYIVWMAANGYAVWATMVPASVIAGIVAGPLWAAQGSYFTLIAPRYAALTKNTDEATVTRFFGIFFGLFQASGITGSILSSTILLTSPGNATIDPDDPALDYCGAKSCPNQEINATNPNLDEPPQSVVWILLGVYITIAFIAVAIMAFFVDRLPEDLRVDQATSCGESTELVLATAKHYRHKETLFLLLITMYSGMEAAFYNAEFFQAYVSCSVGIWMVGYVTLPFGIVNALTSFFTTRLAKYTGQLPFFISALVVDLCIQFTLIFWMPRPDQSWLLFVLSAMWGYTDGIWQTHVLALYGVVFPSETEAAFSSRMVSSSLGYVIAFSYSYFLCTSVKIYILMAVLLTGMLGYLAVEIPRLKAKSYAMKDDEKPSHDVSLYKSTQERDVSLYKSTEEREAKYGYFNDGYL